jgi:hypothetical protein
VPLVSSFFVVFFFFLRIQTVASLASLPSLVIGGTLSKDSPDVAKVRSHAISVLREEKPAPLVKLASITADISSAG